MAPGANGTVYRMLDTVRLESPPLTAEQARALEVLGTRRTTSNVASGEVVRDFTSLQLRGSWDSRVSVQVKRERAMGRDWRMVDRGLLFADRDTGEVYGGRLEAVPTPPRWEPCLPYAVVEASPHKVIAGHNCYGGPEDVTPACRWLLDRVAFGARCALPPWHEWSIRRLDWAEVFVLDSFEAVSEFFAGNFLAEFPRRGRYTFGQDGLMWVGAETTLKLYHKGPEFSEHDYGRVERSQGRDVARELVAQADRLVRVEVEVRGRKLVEALGPGYEDATVVVGDVEADHLKSVYDAEVGRLLQEGRSSVNTVRRFRAVEARLFDYYPSRAKARRLFGHWLKLAALGEATVKRELPKRTFLRLKRELVQAGVAWTGTDVRIVAQLLVPEDFAPVRDDPRRWVGELERVSDALAPYRDSDSEGVA